MPGPVYLSINEFPGDGSTTQYEFNFAGGYLSRTHVKAYVQDALGGITQINVVDAMFVNDTTLDVGIAAPTGGLTRIYRETPRDLPLVDFSGGARVSEANLDTITRQAIMAVAEAFDVGAYAAVNDLLSAVGEAAAAASANAATAVAARAAAELASAAAIAARVAAEAARDTAVSAATAPGVQAVLDNLTAVQNAATNAAAAVAAASAAGLSANSAAESADEAAAHALAASAFDPAVYGPLGSHRNRLINGDFSKNSRALTSVADDAYCLDRWYILTETGSVTVAKLTDPESGASYGIRLTQPSASPKRMGFAQIIESANIRQYANRAMHLAARLRLSTGANIRYAIIEHTGTADVVTSDVVNNWASATFTPSNFFIAGINVLSTGTITPGAATWGEVSTWAALGSGVKNVIVFIWTESQVAQNVTLDCSRIQYEPGVVATPHEWRMDELSLCAYYTLRKNVRWRLDQAWTVGVSAHYTDHFAQMRAVPGVVVNSDVSTGLTGTPTVYSMKPTCALWALGVAATGPVAREIDMDVTYTAEL